MDFEYGTVIGCHHCNKSVHEIPRYFMISCKCYYCKLEATKWQTAYSYRVGLPDAEMHTA